MKRVTKLARWALLRTDSLFAVGSDADGKAIVTSRILHLEDRHVTTESGQLYYLEGEPAETLGLEDAEAESRRQYRAYVETLKAENPAFADLYIDDEEES